MMMSINRPDSLARQVSSFGLGGLASNPAILKLTKDQQEIILKNTADADANNDGALSLNEYAALSEYCFGLRRALLFTMILFDSRQHPLFHSGSSNE